MRWESVRRLREQTRAAARRLVDRRRHQRGGDLSSGEALVDVTVGNPLGTVRVVPERPVPT